MSFDSEEHMFWWIFVGSRGGKMRLKIVESLMQSPANANQLAQKLGVNYRTIEHHLRVLESNGIVKSEGPRYGLTFFATDSLRANYPLIRRLLEEGGGV
ncbi:winged helix-turn-helix domain-containing protein [Tardisphaera miroshnichenkoae]